KRPSLAWLAGAALPKVPRDTQKRGLVQRLRGALLQARRRWGLRLVRLVVSVVVGVELMAARDAETAARLVQDAMEAASNGVKDFTGKKDYKFGDVTKAAMTKFASGLKSGISSYTGKEDYEFGDLTKATVSKFTGKDSYKFGDITKAAAEKISDAASSTAKQITGKEDYEFGDITRSLISKVRGRDGEDDEGDRAKS
ncbi:unnamed protein product, partial [Symbiodinium natans]